MRRLILAAALLAPLTAHAQQPEPQYAATGVIAQQAAHLADQITLDHQQIAQLQQQLTAMTAERDKLKAGAAPKDAPKP